MGNTSWLQAPRKGVLLALASSFLVSVCSVGVKVTTSIPVGQIIFSTYLLLLIISLILCLYNPTDETIFPKENLLLLWGRTLFTLPIVIFSYKAVRLLPLTDEALIAYTSIIFTIIFGRLFLNEKFTKNKLLASAGILIGVFLITFGPIPKNTLYLNGCLFALISAICDAISYIIIKRITHLDYRIILLNFSLISIIFTGPFYFFEIWTIKNFSILILISIFGAFQELFCVISLTSEEAAVVCMLHASDIIFSYLWELCLFSEIYTIAKITGALIVLLSVIFSAYLPNDEEYMICCEDDDKDLPDV